MINRDLDITVQDLDCSAEFFGKDYIVVCHASYEDRSLSICDHIFEENMVVAAILISSEEYLDATIYKSNKKKLKDYLEKISKNVIEITSGKDTPVANLLRFEGALSTLDPHYKNFLVDISTFPRDRLVSVLDYLIKIRGEASKIKYIYSSPEGYGSETESGWLTKGVRKIEPIPRFNGKQKTRRETLLVMLLGHEGERSLITLRNLEPDKLIIIAQGKLQVNANAQEISMSSNASLLNESKHLLLENGIIEVPYSNPNAIDEILEDIWERYSSLYNIIISASGTKLQVLGALITCLRHREIQITYAYPQTYNIENYSRNIGPKYFGEFIFK